MDYIWDLDGTLLDSYGVIVSSLAEVAAGAGLQDTEERILPLVKQGTVSGYLRELSGRTGGEYDALYQEYRRISHAREDRITLIPGAKETLRRLREGGARHFVYTHRGASTRGLLDRLGMTEFFEEIVTWEAGFLPKPSGEAVRYLIRKYHLDPEQTAYVGDRSIDVGCARDAGIRAILFRPVDSCVLETGEEDLIVEKLEQIASSL